MVLSIMQYPWGTQKLYKAAKETILGRLDLRFVTFGDRGNNPGRAPTQICKCAQKEINPRQASFQHKLRICWSSYLLRLRWRRRSRESSRPRPRRGGDSLRGLRRSRESLRPPPRLPPPPM